MADQFKFLYYFEWLVASQNSALVHLLVPIWSLEQAMNLSVGGLISLILSPHGMGPLE